MNRLNATPLIGIKIIELAGLAPGPFCGLILADFGADVLLIERKNSTRKIDQRLTWNKKKVEIDFQSEIKTLEKLCIEADVLIDPFRPGTLENMGLNPIELLKTNKKLIIARISGFGQTGLFSNKAGHDINFLALSGIMPIACGENLRPPVNLLGDFAGGSLIAAFGIVLALYQRTKNDDKHMAVGALEPKFYLKFFEVLGLDPKNTAEKMYLEPFNVSHQIQKIFESKTQDEWTNIFLKTDACVTPVLDLKSVNNFYHHIQRNAFKKIKGQKFKFEDKIVSNPVPIFLSSENAKSKTNYNLKSNL